MFWRKFKFHLLAGMLVVTGGVNLALLNNQDVTAISTTPRLFVKLAVGSPSGAMVAGDSQEVLKFSLSAVGADFQIKSIGFNKMGTCKTIGKGEATLRDIADLVNPIAVLPAGTGWFGKPSIVFLSSSFTKPLVVAKDSSMVLVLKGDTAGCTGRVTFTIPYNGVSAQYLRPTSFIAGNVTGGTLMFSTPPMATTNLKATLAAGSPSGTDMPKTNQELLRFTLAVSGNEDIAIKNLNFKLSTACQFSANPINAWLYDRMDMVTPIKTWSWTSKTDFINGFSTGDFNKVIAGQQAKVYSLIFDTSICRRSNASGSGDTLKLDLIGGTWQTASPNRVISGSLTGTPIQGGMIAY
ncbi:MAG: hypothetical protein Q8M83_04025 [bacterium]|nr:hypothetical protein [bacterium]